MVRLQNMHQTSLVLYKIFIHKKSASTVFSKMYKHVKTC